VRVPLNRITTGKALGIGLLAMAIGSVSAGPVPQRSPRVQPPALGWFQATQSSPVVAMHGLPAFSTEQPAAYDVRDPATWSNAALAAQLTVSCINIHDVRTARAQAAAGIGGVTLLGSDPDRHLARRLKAAGTAAPHDLLPFVMSDEEGGLVQRLRSMIYPLPSAQQMGGWRVSRVRRTAEHYAVRMRRLGVQMDLAPVSDLAVRGSYIASLHRAFSPDVARVAALDRAWRVGMNKAGVVTVLKHWPGHGSARDSHSNPASVPPLTTLERRDMRPFDAELSHGARVVMVGHLTSAGLTEPGIPASESPRALRYLRAQAGPDVVVLTDALNMVAASRSVGLTPASAAVRALRAGADWALVCSPHPLRTVATIRDAIAADVLPRAQAVASARRIVALKSAYGLAPR
jgi:beta-N-acetylhexosaminidase